VLSQSHDQSRGFGTLIQVKPSYFFYFLSMRLSQSDDSGNGFDKMTRVVFYVFF
jgi:hypothetical protein